MYKLHLHCAIFALTLAFFFGFAGNSFSETNQSNSLFHGLYAGGTIGYSSFDTDLKNNGTEIDGVSASDLNVGAFAGSGTNYQNFYYGLEGHFNVNNADFEETDGTDKLEMDFEESYGLSARLGSLISDTVLAYGLLGWQQLNIDVSDNLGNSDDESFDGFRVGAGVEFQTSQNVFIRGQYSHTFYGSEKLEETDVEPESGNFQMGLGFRF